MDFDEVLRRRRMVRAYRPDPIPPEVLDPVLAAARRAPSAGNTDGTDLVLLEGSEQTNRYWDITLPAGAARERFGHPGLLEAPALVVLLADADAYLRRYSEPDKQSSG